MAKAPEMGLFGVALPPGAEVQHADEEMGLYRAQARIDDVAAFYEAVYGKTEGLEVAIQRDPPPVHVSITATDKCPDAAFGIVTAVASPADERKVDIVVTRRSDADEEGYENTSPWLQAKKAKAAGQ